MNTGAKLDFSKSALLSLKAELARKHEEATASKAQSQGNYIKPIAKPTKSTIFSRTNSGLEQRQQNDIDELTPEEGSQLNLSRQALEEKAKIYDSLAQKPTPESSVNYLVDFAQKSLESINVDPCHGNLKSDAEEIRRHEKEEEEEEARRADSDEYDVPSDPEEDWVDFTDCLGRTRRCLRRDLSRFKQLDSRLFQSLEPKRDEEPQEANSSRYSSCTGQQGESATPDLLSDDMRREQQRLKWEEEEEKLRDKTEVHYQDLLFDEARTHGVGYFPFAKEESSRRSQQDELRRLRAETERRQQGALQQRERRQQMVRARLRAAHNRKRAREGLPPLGEDEELPGEREQEEEVEKEEPVATPPIVQRATGPRLKPSPAIRPWDIGKEGVPSKPVMTQEEWVDKKRTERNNDFAPPSFYEDRVGDERYKSRRRPSNPPPPKRKQEAPGPQWPPQPEPEPDPDIQPQPGGLFFTSKRRRDGEWRTPMEEEEDLTGEQLPADNETASAATSARGHQRVGVEVAPPPTFEYYGPSSSAGRARHAHRPEDLSSAISAGLKYLRQQAEEKEKRPEKGLLDII